MKILGKRLTAHIDSFIAASQNIFTGSSVLPGIELSVNPSDIQFKTIASSKREMNADRKRVCKDISKATKQAERKIKDGKTTQTK